MYHFLSVFSYSVTDSCSYSDCTQVETIRGVREIMTTEGTEE